MITIPSPPSNPLPAMSEAVKEAIKGDRPKLRFYLMLGTILTFTILLIFLGLWMYLRPSNPNFNLQDVTVSTFNVSSNPPALSLYMQITLSSTSTMSRVDAEFHPMELYGMYRDQQVTLGSLLPRTHQGHKETVVWSPYLKSYEAPISPFSAQSLVQDMNAGALRMEIKVKGDVKWKVGSLTTGKYHLYVSCPANLRFESRMIINGGVAVGPGVVKGQPLDHCNVEVAR